MTKLGHCGGKGPYSGVHGELCDSATMTEERETRSMECYAEPLRGILRIQVWLLNCFWASLEKAEATNEPERVKPRYSKRHLLAGRCLTPLGKNKEITDFRFR